MCVKRVPQKNRKSSAPFERNFLMQNMAKTKEKASKSEDFEASLVEISGIEPLTS